jgi:hypothetical protein
MTDSLASRNGDASSAPPTTADDERFASMRAVYDESTWRAIQTAKVLVVGAGGIGQKTTRHTTCMHDSMELVHVRPAPTA